MSSFERNTIIAVVLYVLLGIGLVSVAVAMAVYRILT